MSKGLVWFWYYKFWGYWKKSAVGKAYPLTCPTLPRCSIPVLLGVSRLSLKEKQDARVCSSMCPPQSPRAAGKRGWKSLSDCFRGGPADVLSLWAVKCPCFHHALVSLTVFATIISWGTETSPASYLHLSRSWQINTAQESNEVWEAWAGGDRQAAGQEGPLARWWGKPQAGRARS